LQIFLQIFLLNNITTTKRISYKAKKFCNINQLIYICSINNDAMKEQILTALKQKYANLGLSDQVLSSVSEMLANSVTEESAIEGAISGVEPLLKAVQGDNDRIRTAAAKKQQSKKEESTSQPQGAEQRPEPQQNEQPPEWAKALISTVSTLTNEINAIKGEKISNSRKGVLDELIKDLPDSLKKAYSRTNFADLSDEDFTTLTSDIKKEVEEVNKQIGIKGGIFKTPLAGAKKNPTEKSDKEINEVVDKIKF
jgi:hypothetical protein